MIIPLTIRNLSARDALLSLSLLGVAAVCAMTGYRWDILVCYGIAVLCTWRRTERSLLDVLHLEHSEIPSSVGIGDQVLRAIGAGILKPGEKMPTMRQVAVALRIDLNTVRDAYDQLAQANVIVFQPPHGMVVAHPPPGSKQAEPTYASSPATHWFYSTTASGTRFSQVHQQVDTR